MIGYYVHHHGTGHFSRAAAIARRAPGRFVLLGSGLAGRCDDVECVDLPDDREPAAGRQDALPHTLHYAPLNSDALRRRAALLTGWIAARRPALLVVDVSVEIAMLARLSSTPAVYVRLAGRRDDAAHQEAFRGARALLAPFHPALDDLDILPWVREKTQYFPGLTAPAPDVVPRPDSVLLVLGTGGTALTGAEIAAAAAATPALHWRVIGPAPAVPDPPPNLTCAGWVADAAAEIAAAEIVVGAAGDGVVNAVLAAGRPFVCIPQARPYDEQRSKARRLAELGAAVTLPAWPAGPGWGAVIAKARDLRPPPLHDSEGVRRAAEFLIRMAGE